MTDQDPLFVRRKLDHIQLSLKTAQQAEGLSGLQFVELQHEALPDLNFSEICLEEKIFSKSQIPLLVSSMTAGTEKSSLINAVLLEACQQTGWSLGVGSQRGELSNELSESSFLTAFNKTEITALKSARTFSVFGNLGISQLIHTPTEKILSLIKPLSADGFIVHLNPLQECLQAEGTPQFKGGLGAIQRLCTDLKKLPTPIPVIVKETGCGISASTAEKLFSSGIFALDVSGLGGTHWGRVEGARVSLNDPRAIASQTFSDWGIGTVQSLRQIVELSPPYQVWASGGVRTGLDAAKLFSLGAQFVGFAAPVMKRALEGTDSVVSWMKQVEFELKVALFCTGSATIADLRKKGKAKIYV